MLYEKWPILSKNQLTSIKLSLNPPAHIIPEASVPANLAWILNDEAFDIHLPA